MSKQSILRKQKQKKMVPSYPKSTSVDLNLVNIRKARVSRKQRVTREWKRAQVKVRRLRRLLLKQHLEVKTSWRNYKKKQR